MCQSLTRCRLDVSPLLPRWVKHEQLDTVLTWIKGELDKDAQVYFISPLIEESEALDLKNAVALHQELTDFFGDSATVALMHGRMKNDEKTKLCKISRIKNLRF